MRGRDSDQPGTIRQRGQCSIACHESIIGVIFSIDVLLSYLEVLSLNGEIIEGFYRIDIEWKQHSGI